MIRLLTALFLLLAGPVWAVEPDEILDDPVLEERARAVSANVRCVVCQNEPIDSSNAGVARDLRILIRERLVAGDTDQEVFDFLVARYGEFVLFKPPLSPRTWVLWFGPFVILGLGICAVILTLRRVGLKETKALSAEEEAALSRLEREDEE